MTEVCSAGFPHSDICGSKDICSSPQLFAAYHVFHRLSVPRHPPCALISLIIKAIFSLSYYFRNEYIFDLNRRYCFLFVSMSFNIFTGCLFYLIRKHCSNIFLLYAVFKVQRITIPLSFWLFPVITYKKFFLYLMAGNIFILFNNLAPTYSPMPSPA